MMRDCVFRIGPTGQRGVAVLAVTVILLLIATIGTLMIGRVGLTEQRIVGTNVRSKEVYSAAIGGLEFGVEWLEENVHTLTSGWADTDGDGKLDISPMTVDAVTLNADQYNRTVTYVAMTDLDLSDGSPVIIQVKATATAVADSHITKTVKKEVLVGETPLFSPDSGGASLSEFSGPPILLEDCVDDSAAGTPDVYTDDPTDIAIGSTQGTGASCLEAGHLDQSSCTDHPTCSSASVVDPPVMRVLAPPKGLWESVFGSNTKADLLELEERRPDVVAILDDGFGVTHGQMPAGASMNANQIGGTWGSASQPMIIVVDEGRSNNCPGTQGGTVIHGLFYFETTASGTGAGGCSFNGWGNTKIYGTLAKEGGAWKLNGNTELYDTDLDFGGTSTGTSITTGITVSPTYGFSDIWGSWRDF